MTYYAFLWRRPQDKQAMAVIYQSKDLAERCPHRVSEVVEVKLKERHEPVR
jgi:hypothetical protein